MIKSSVFSLHAAELNWFVISAHLADIELTPVSLPEWSQCGINQTVGWCWKGMPWEVSRMGSSSMLKIMAKRRDAYWDVGKPRSWQKERNPWNKSLVPGAVAFCADCKKFFVGMTLGILIQEAFHFFPFCQNLCELETQVNSPSNTQWINTGLQEEDYIFGSSLLFFLNIYPNIT